MPSFDEITEQWKKRLGGVRQYEVVEEAQDVSAIPLEPVVLEGEYDRAQALLRSLLRTYRGRTLPEVLPGERVSNVHGSCLRLETACQGSISTFQVERTRAMLFSDLRLLYGIGEVTQQRLKKEGVRSVLDLLDHPLWGGQARELVGLVDRADTVPLQKWLWRWLPKSHPEALSLAGLHDRGDFLMLDIESMGLFGRPIILIGLARPQGEAIAVDQYLLRDLSDEPAALTELCARVTERTVLITYNGRSFDLPCIEERLGYYGLDPLPRCLHLDILHFARRRWRNCYDNCALTTLERMLFGLQRNDDVPSALVPEFYEAYLKEGNAGPLLPIVQHNRQDVLTLAKLYSVLCRRWGHGHC